MGDSLLILAPLLVLAVVLLLGFAGCGFASGTEPSPPTLTFRAQVPKALKVLPPGVKFTWTTPDLVPGEEMGVASDPDSSVGTYIAGAIALGPSLFWTLGSGNGLTDLSPNGRDGTALGGVTVGGELDGPTDLPGGTATLFDGANDGIRSSYNPFVGTTARTFVGWARWDSGGPAQHTLFASSTGLPLNRPTLRVVVGSRDVEWLPSGPGEVITWTGAAAPEDTWFMWALRANPGNNEATLYINGNKVSEQPMTSEWPGAPGNFQAAVGATSVLPFKGAQGLVAVYERALADTEVASLYQASKAFGHNLHEYQISQPKAGGWPKGRCEMTVQADGQSAPANSPDFAFTLEVSKHYVLLFQVTGSPLVEPPGVQVTPQLTEAP